MLKNVKLKELGEIFTGSTPSKKNKEFYNSEDIMFIKPDILDFDIVNIGVSNEYISEKAREKARIIPANSLLVSCIGSIGKLGINEKEVAFNQQINAIVPNNKIKSSRYLAYLLKYNQKKLESIANAPVVPIINKTQFSEFEVLIHENLNFQEQITQILDKSKEIIEKRKEQIQFLDKLVKSKFIEMFNIWFSNKESYRKLVEICNFIDYRGKTPEKSEIGIPLITAKNVKNNRFSFEPREYIPMKNYKDVMTRGIPSVNDILFTTEAPLGNVCRIPNIEGEFCVGQRLITMKPLEEICSEYLEYALLSKQFQGEMWKHASGSTVKGIRSKELVKLSIPVPPIELQNQFANFAKQVDKLKFEMEKSLKDLEDNFNSLMQNAFKGELFN
ncbi:restriction endonuclease subunit S [Clostridium perfringens]|uniref:restriction endonuclease subunit S n=1 Tax=Clostridium perfringens TaxID=1502 RepID=UPI000E15C478|nr:restriction endonuclease subunit S [Clostridium perfringens]SUY39313.1 type I restriction-modification system subunit S [Clostridium perfringens]